MFAGIYLRYLFFSFFETKVLHSEISIPRRPLAWRHALADQVCTMWPRAAWFESACARDLQCVRGPYSGQQACLFTLAHLFYEGCRLARGLVSTGTRCTVQRAPAEVAWARKVREHVDAALAQGKGDADNGQTQGGCENGFGCRRGVVGAVLSFMVLLWSVYGCCLFNWRSPKCVQEVDAVFPRGMDVSLAPPSPWVQREVRASSWGTCCF